MRAIIVLCVGLAMSAFPSTILCNSVADTTTSAFLDLNSDCVVDTVYTVTDTLGNRRLHSIRWGERPQSGGCDSTHYADTTKVFRTVTFFAYSGFDTVKSVSLSSLKLNHDDGMFDAIVRIRGKLVYEHQGPDSTDLVIDTVAVIAIYCQRDIDTAQWFTLSLDTGFHYTPVVHKYLASGSDIIEYGVSHRSNVSLSTIQLCSVAVSVHDTSGGQPKQGAQTSQVSPIPGQQPLQLRAVPNPASDEVVLIVEDEIIDMSVSFISADGRTHSVLSSKLAVTRGSQLKVDVSRLPSGTYRAVVTSNQDGRSGLVNIVLRR